MRITDETRLSWGKLLRERLAGVTDLHAIVAERIAKQETLEAGLKAALDRVAEASSDEGDALAALTAASEDAARKLRLVGLKLEEAHLEGRVDDETYRAVVAAAFPRGTGTARGTPADRYNLAKRVATALREHSAVDPDGSLLKIVEGAVAELESCNAAAKQEAAARQQAHEALGRARVTWDDGYLATKEIVSGLLRDAGRHSELRKIFPDLF